MTCRLSASFQSDARKEVPGINESGDFKDSKDTSADYPDSESSGSMSSGKVSDDEPSSDDDPSGEHPPESDAAKVLHEWREARRGFMEPDNLELARGSVENLLATLDCDYTAREFPVLASQLLVASTRPCTFDRMPQDCEDVEILLYEYEEFINRQIDLYPELLEKILTPRFWVELFSICFRTPGSDMQIDEDSDLPLISFPNKERTDGTKPDDNVFFIRVDGQVMMVFAGRADYQWFNLQELSTGTVSRLRVLVLRFQPSLPWAAISPGRYIRYSYVASDDDELGPQRHGRESDEFDAPSDQCVHDSHRFDEIVEYLPRDSQHPTQTLWLDKDDGREIYRLPSRGPKRPGYFYRTFEGALVSVSMVRGGDAADVQCLKPLSDVVANEKFEVEITSDNIPINGAEAELAAWYKDTLNDLYTLKDFRGKLGDPQSVSNQVYRIFYKCLEQILYDSGRRLNYIEVFHENWASFKKHPTLSESSVVFHYPYTPKRSQMVANATIVLAGNNLVRMFVSLSEVGDTGPYYQHTTTDSILRLEILGRSGLTKLRDSVERVSTGESKEEVVDILFKRSTNGVIHVDQKKKPVWPDPSDEGDVRNLQRIMQLVVSAVNCSQFGIRTSQPAASQRLDQESRYVVAQTIEFTLKSVWMNSEIIVAIRRVFTERRKRPQWHRGHLGPMKGKDVQLTIKVLSGHDSSWPVETKYLDLHRIAEEHLPSIDVYTGPAHELIIAFNNGGNAKLSCLEGSHWERYYYLEMWVRLDVHMLDFVRYLSLIAGSSPFDCQLLRSEYQNKLIWAGVVKGEKDVPDRRISISMYPELFRHCQLRNWNEPKSPLLTLEFQVSFCDEDIALHQVFLITTISQRVSVQ